MDQDFYEAKVQAARNGQMAATKLVKDLKLHIAALIMANDKLVDQNRRLKIDAIILGAALVIVSILNICNILW